MAKLDTKLDAWKKQLLDIGKRNRLINFKETKRSNILITSPGLLSIYNQIVLQEKELSFPHPKKISFNDEGEEVIESFIEGDFETNKTINDLQKTLKALRLKAKTSIEEQGINTLYLTFGLIKWTEINFSSQIISSPILLVPVTLKVASVSSPFVLQLHEDEIVINPTLIHKFENDFGLKLPEFDSLEADLDQYLANIQTLIEDRSWKVSKDVHLTILSFLKINMYKDLDKNRDKIFGNNIITAISGDNDFMSLPSEYNNFDHDLNIRPLDSYQVVDADSSQQDAILLANKGISFVLQGPPGTGKSQTITNIISESIANGKKVLFVSEKMAALQVVHKRLTQTGLSDFCLTMHSHKANKKEILKELDNTLNLDKIKVLDEAIYQLSSLKQTREKLNSYSTELHTVCQPLNKSIYDINGKVAALAAVPEVIFPIEGIQTISPEQLSNYIYLLGEFSKTIGKLSEDYSINPWRNSNVNLVTHELRHDVESKGKKLASQIKIIALYADNLLKKYKLEFPLSIRELEPIIAVLSVAANSPKIPIEWVSQPDSTIVEKQVTRCESLQLEHNRLSIELGSKYNVGWESFQGIELKNEIETSIDQLQNLLNANTFKTKNELVKKLNSIKSEGVSILETLVSVFDESQKVSGLLGLENPTTVSSCENLVRLLEMVIRLNQPAEFWFEQSIDDLSAYCEQSKVLHQDAVTLRKKIEQDFDKEIFLIDADSMLKRFRIDYTSIFKLFKRNYWHDKKVIKAGAANQNSNSDVSIVILLIKLKQLKEKEQLILESKNKSIKYFGNHYREFNTDWDNLSSNIDVLRKILNWFDGRNLPTNFRQAMVDGTALNLAKHSMPILSVLITKNIAKRVTELIDDASTSFNIQQLQIKLNDVLKFEESIANSYGNFVKLSVHTIEFSQAMDDLNQLVKVQAISNEIKSRESEFNLLFGYLYLGFNTDWSGVREKFQYWCRFKTAIDLYNLPIGFVMNVCQSEDFISVLRAEKNKLIEQFNELQGNFKWFCELFETSEKFASTNLFTFLDRLEKCLNNLFLLEEWIDFRNNRMNCIKNGLGTYVEVVENEKIKSELITAVYLKRFYRLWLDVKIGQFPAVSSFRRNSFEETINQFRQQDKNQFRIAQSRIREKLISSLPDVNSATTSRDEFGILKRELNKQRKLMPLRKLFFAIPNLLTSLKPCLMMSPLSVSLFLEADSYSFDLIIFDEASQVRTEDAIGAIMRGKQVIIVGDNKQLPPTSFFATSTANDEFDTDEDDENTDVDAYESILDEALKSIPERSLKWHYRSRHEHLIAFSNAKIYNHNLVTFPSNVDKVKNNGVEYIYVSDGVYDRGGKRSNLKEAKRVAELVFEHIRTNPKRSLGVVTFSEAQQQMVDSTINELRLLNPQLEHFFSEEREECFFIKNLENVQGDERDTIIFSIGYAKDTNGIMYMNFGPLGKPGGHRRLNVAITRAKYNVKLVGSIFPTDINIEKTNSEGVRMLRSYIDFAINGASTLQNELKFRDTVELESPFEVSVYGFLTSKGYSVATQIGCSGYRIDMAVKHPKLSGVFILGIECDGATYHNSRTARERDRLRQTVLEDIGWKIYRIWSTDWIKDPITEGDKLIKTVEKTLANFSETELSVSFSNDRPHIPDDFVQTNFNQIEEVINEPLTDQEKYNFVEYIETDIEQLLRSTKSPYPILVVLRGVIENEYPIHFENLCKKVAPIYGFQKATQNVKNTILNVLDRDLKNEIVKNGEFISPKNSTDIPVRVPKLGSENIRPVNYISNEELAEAMLAIAKKSYGIRPEDLTVKTARIYGFNRTGTNITQAFRDAFDFLRNSERIKIVDGNKVIAV